MNENWAEEFEKYRHHFREDQVSMIEEGIKYFEDFFKEQIHVKDLHVKMLYRPRQINGPLSVPHTMFIQADYILQDQKCSNQWKLNY